MSTEWITQDANAEMIAWEYAKSVYDSGAGSVSSVALGEELAEFYDHIPGIDWTAIAVDLMPDENEVSR